MSMDSNAYDLPGRDMHLLRIVKSNSGLIAYPFFLVLFEVVFTPASAYLMAIYYEHPEFQKQKRFTLFWGAGLIAGAFGALLVYALVHIDGICDSAG